MSQTQVHAGIALLKKVMPDLAAIEHSGEGGVTSVKFVTMYEKKKE